MFIYSPLCGMIYCKLLGDPGAGLPSGKPSPDPPREFLELAARIPIIPQVRLFDLAQANEALQLLKAGRLDGAGALKVGK
jgi:hypothetical protein